MPNTDFIYLASASPRRAVLLDRLGVVHRPLLADPSENVEALEQVRSGEPAGEYVRRVALAKLTAARRRRERRRLPEAPILAADTTVVLGRRILGKPADAEEAAAMLRGLSGRSHRVMTAVAVSAGRESFLDVNVTRVHFAVLSERSIRQSIESGEPFGKAGAYAIQGRMAAWIHRIDGSFSSVMGLPLFETTRLLSRARVRLDL